MPCRVLPAVALAVFSGCQPPAASDRNGDPKPTATGTGGGPPPAAAPQNVTPKPTAPVAPATLAEVRDCVDWTKLPRPPGAADFRQHFSTASYTAPGTFLEVAEFFRKAWPAAGWTEDPVRHPSIDQKDYLSVSFERGPMRLAASGFRPEPGGPMTITVSLGGNVDLRPFPKPADAKVETDMPQVVYYHTAAKPDAAADVCRKTMVAAGWAEAAVGSAKFHAKEGRFVTKYVKNAMEITAVAAAEPDGRTGVRWSTAVRHLFDPDDVRAVLTAKDVPTPATLKEYLAVLDLREFPRMDGAKPRDRHEKEPLALSTAVAYQAPATVAEAVAFHRKELAARGWAETDADGSIPGRVALSFEKGGYLVTVGAYRPDGAKAVEVGVTNHGNVDVRQLPYPPGAEIGALRDTSVNATTTLGEAAAVAFYQAELGKQGWKEEKSRGRGTYRFGRNVTVLFLEIGTDSEERTSIKVRPELLAVE